MQRQLFEVFDRETRATHRQLTREDLPPKHRDDLEVDQLGRGEVLACEAPADAVTGVAVIRKAGSQDTRVNDEHGPP